jgi:hypothetical protein
MGSIVKTRAVQVGSATGIVGLFYAIMAGAANAAASPTTGIDYVSDLVTPIKSELTLAIVAGLGLLVVLMAVRSGVKLVRSFGK